GIAKVVGGDQLTQTGAIVGTPEYLAPEQALGGTVDHRADLYALGVVAYELLTGRAPFKAPTPIAVIHAHVYTPPPPPRELNQRPPQAVAAVLVRALSKSPNERFQSGRELMIALQRAFGQTS